MNATVREWLDKAEGDIRTARRELEVADEPNYDAVCFHAQQCIEKMIKAALIHTRVVPPRTHDLELLDGLLRTSFPTWTCEPADLRFLSRAAVAFRYPGEQAVREDANEAVSICDRLRQTLILLLDTP